MDVIVKKRLRAIMESNQRGKLKFLYHYYREEYFDGDRLPANIVAALISDDLKLPIEPHSIRRIQREYQAIKCDGESGASDNDNPTSKEKSNTPQQKQDEGEEKEEWVFPGPKSYGDELRKQFAKHLKNPPKDES